MLYLQVITHSSSPWKSNKQFIQEKFKHHLKISSEKIFGQISLNSNFIEIKDVTFQPNLDVIGKFKLVNYLYGCIEPFIELRMKIGYYLNFTVKNKNLEFFQFFRILIGCCLTSLLRIIRFKKTSLNTSKLRVIGFKHLFAINSFLESEHKIGIFLEDDAGINDSVDFQKLFLQCIEIVNDSQDSVLFDLNNYFNVEDFFPGSKEFPSKTNSELVEIPPFLGTACSYVLNRNAAETVASLLLAHPSKIWSGPDWAFNLCISDMTNFGKIKAYRFRESLIENLSLSQGLSSVGTKTRKNKNKK